MVYIINFTIISDRRLQPFNISNEPPCFYSFTAGCSCPPLAVQLNLLQLLIACNLALITRFIAFFLSVLEGQIKNRCQNLQVASSFNKLDGQSSSRYPLSLEKKLHIWNLMQHCITAGLIYCNLENLSFANKSYSVQAMPCELQYLYIWYEMVPESIYQCSWETRPSDYFYLNFYYEIKTLFVNFYLGILEINTG